MRYNVHKVKNNQNDEYSEVKTTDYNLIKRKF